MTEEVHSIKNCIKSMIKWKREPNYDLKLSNCNFLQSQTSTPVERFCKPGWHKLHQQHMSTLNTNRNIQTVLLDDSLIQGLFIHTKVWNSFFGKDIKLWYTGRQSRKLIMASGKTRISTRYQTNNYSLRDQ